MKIRCPICDGEGQAVVKGGVVISRCEGCKGKLLKQHLGF